MQSPPALAVILAMAGVLSCNQNQQPQQPVPAEAPARAAPPTEHPPPESGVVVHGRVAFSSPPPALSPPNKGIDPFCARAEIKDESVVVNGNGTLRNVLIRVTSGVRGTYPVPAGPVIIDQSGCMYRPRVQMARTGQTVLIRNGDQTLHNVHALRGPSTLFNKVQMNAQSAPIEWRTAESGTLLKLRCDVHQWMTGFLYVSDHPFVAVTGDDGTFQIPHLPEGSFTVEAWHERFGIKSAQLEVRKGRPAELNFSYSGQEPPAPQ